VAVATLPVANLQNSLRARVMRIAAVAGSIYGDIAADATADIIAIAHHNLDPAALIRARLFDGAGQTGTTVYDSGEIPIDNIIPLSEFRYSIDPWASFVDDMDFPRNFPLIIPIAVVYRSIQIDITNVGSPIEIARLFVGQSFTPVHNYDYGASLRWVEPAAQTRTEGGSLHVELAERYRRIQLRLSHLPDTDRAILSRELRKIGKGGDILLSTQPDRSDDIGREETIICKFINDIEFTHANFNRHVAPLIFEES